MSAKIKLIVTLLIWFCSQNLMAQTQPSVTDLATRKKLAVELMNAIEYQKVIQGAVDDGPIVLKKTFQNKNSEFKKENESKYAQALAQYESAKANMSKELLDKFANLLAKKYSAAELQYLIDLSKNSLNKSFNTFLQSKEVTDLQTEPFKKIVGLIKDAPKAQPPKPKTDSK